METVLLILLQFVFVFCVLFAIISDFRTLTIPNWVSLALIAAFAVFAALHWEALPLKLHLYWAGGVLVVGLAFFILGWFGGGDVKLLTAVSLWTGPAYSAGFIVLTAFLGAGFAILLVALRWVLARYPAFEGGGFYIAERLVAMARKGVCPYGIPIGVAALSIAPAMFL